MLSEKTATNLQRHQKLAGQWLKQREKFWRRGGSLPVIKRLEQRLFHSLALLSTYALVWQESGWPKKPYEQWALLIALFQRPDQDAWQAALTFLSESHPQLDDGDFERLSSALWLAQPTSLTKQQLECLVDSGVLSLLSDVAWQRCHWPETTLRKLVNLSSRPLADWGVVADIGRTPLSDALRRWQLGEASAEGLVVKELETLPLHHPQRRLLAFMSSPTAQELWQQQVQRDPEALLVCALDGNHQTVQWLHKQLAIADLNAYAAAALEQILGHALEQVPTLKDSDTGKAPEGAEWRARLTPPSPFNGVMLQGRPQTETSLAEWLLSQPDWLQRLALLKIGLLRQQPIPDISHHWLHSQCEVLANETLSPVEVARAAG